MEAENSDPMVLTDAQGLPPPLINQEKAAAGKNPYWFSEKDNPKWSSLSPLQQESQKAASKEWTAQHGGGGRRAASSTTKRTGSKKSSRKSRFLIPVNPMTDQKARWRSIGQWQAATGGRSFGPASTRLAATPSILNDDEWKYIITRVNPFDLRAGGAHYPDSVGNRSSGVTQRWDFDYTVTLDVGAADDGPVIWQLQPLYGNGSTGAVMMTWDPSDGTPSPDATVISLPANDTAARALGGRLRLVGAGLRVWNISNAQTLTGVLKGGLMQPCIQTSIAAWLTVDQVSQGLGDASRRSEVQDAKRGITVRWEPKLSTETTEWTQSAGSSIYPTSFNAPTIVATRAKDQTYHVSAYTHYEFSAVADTSAMPMETHQPRPNIELVNCVCSEFPIASEGHTFKEAAEVIAHGMKIVGAALTGGSSIASAVAKML